MTSSTDRPPVHESLNVVDSESVYRNEEWWKSVVKYQFEESSDNSEVAVYLWHHDDGWTRKNKYVVKTPEAWATDRETITRLLSDDTAVPDESLTADYPVNEYYGITAGETVFQSDGWWKAILNVGKKGDYETNEVMVYLWQKRDGDWRRRQKYTIKSIDDLEEEGNLIESMFERDVSSQSTSSDDEGDQRLPRPPKQPKQTSSALDVHLSDSLTRSE